VRSAFIIALMMEAARTSLTSVDNYFTRQHIPEDSEIQRFIYLFINDIEGCSVFMWQLLSVCVKSGRESFHFWSVLLNPLFSLTAVYFTTFFSVTDRVTSECWIVSDLGGSGRGLILN
jgi:hypothetical protein